MGILKLGSQIGQTVKNVGRLKTILTVMGRHGLAEIAERIQLVRLIPGFRIKVDRQKERLSLPERLRHAFEELGPTYVKLGQVLSTRPDLIPEEFVEEFKKLQDDVQPVDFEVIQKTIEAEFKKPVSHVFKSFEKKPLAAASIAQVHKAALADGTEVVVKVQRPGIEKIINTDVSILFHIAGLIHKYIPEAQVFNPKGIVEEFFKSLKKELDFLVEAGNMTRIRKNFEDNPHVVIPQVYRPFSSTKILTLEKLSGIRLSDREKLKASGVDIKQVTHHGVQAFYKMVLVDGLFHGDLHAGNIFVLDGGKIGLIDFGIVGRLNQRTRDAVGNMFLALVSEDYEALVNEYFEIGAPMGRVDMDHFAKQVRELVEPYFGLPLRDVNVGRMLLDLTVIATQHQLSMSQDLMLVCKAIITIEGMGRSIDPDFDVLKEMGDFSSVLIKSRYNPERLSRELLYLFRDTTSLIQTLPRQLKQILRKITNEEWMTHIQIEGLERFEDSQTRGRQLLSLSIIIAAIIVSSSVILVFHTGLSILGLSVFGLLGLGVAVFFCLIYLVSYFKK